LRDTTYTCPFPPSQNATGPEMGASATGVEAPRVGVVRRECDREEAPLARRVHATGDVEERLRRRHLIVEHLHDSRAFCHEEQT
jgi:hypothetical protein